MTDMRFRLLALGCLALLLVLLGACSGTAPTNVDSLSVPTANSQPQPLTAITATGTFQEFSLPQTDSGMMRPAIDHEGRIWFGEMGHNYLGVFDPRTHSFQQFTPPHGLNGVMGIVVAPDNTIWFAEQYANYIGQYFPTTGIYRVYNLPTITVPDPSDASKTLSLPAAPNDIALDSHGNVWFTELNTDSLGRLDPGTGQIQQYPLSATKSVQKLDPYGVTVDPHGIVWFTEAISDHVGRLDPATGSIQFFTMSGPSYPLMEISSDRSGTLWMTSFASGLLLSLNPQTGTFTPYFAPSTVSGSDAGGVYGLLIASDGDVWITLGTENALARLNVATRHFMYYAIPTKGSLPLGLVMGANQSIWFTESGSDKIAMLRP